MTDLIPVTALGGTDARVETIGALSFAENAGLALASLVVPQDAAQPRPFGLTLPGVSQAVRTGGHGAFWTGPGQWMIEGADLADTDFAAALQARAPGCPVTEQTDGFVAFEVTGAAASIEALMAGLVNIDPARLQPGQCARTGLEHMTVFLIRRSAGQLAILGMRSLAGSLWHAVTLAARRL